MTFSQRKKNTFQWFDTLTFAIEFFATLYQGIPNDNQEPRIETILYQGISNDNQEARIETLLFSFPSIQGRDNNNLE